MPSQELNPLIAIQVLMEIFLPERMQEPSHFEVWHTKCVTSNLVRIGKCKA